MDNALIIDGLLAVVLIAGTIIGARRGLFKSLMGLVVVLLALIGAVLLANLLTPYVTDLIYPAVRERAIAFFSAARPAADELLDSLGPLGDLAGPLKRFGLSAAEVDPYLSAVSAAEQAAQLLISSVVHAVLLLLLYVALLIVFKLLTRLLDRVFDLPVLSAFNGLGGAIFGFSEAALLLYVAVYLAARFGVAAVAGHADDTYLLPIFLNHSPVELISSLTQWRT